MYLLDLNPEIVQAIIVCAVEARGLKRGLRLKLVSKRFSGEVDQAMFTTRIADNHSNLLWDLKSPFWPSYLARRVMAERNKSNWHLWMIRETAEFLCRRSGTFDEDSLKNIVQQLSCLAISSGTFKTSWLRGEEPSKESEPLPLHLLTAAAYLGDTPLVSSLMADGWSPLTSSSVFYCPTEAAACEGHTAVVELLMSYGKLPVDTCLQKRFAVCNAIREGNLDMLDLFLEPRYGPSPLTLRGPIHHKIFVKQLKRGIHRTKTPTMFDRIREIFRSLPEFGDGIDLGLCLYEAAYNGSMEMVDHLLKMGASVNGSSEFLSQNPLSVASRTGRNDLVKLLLSHGADPNPPYLLHNMYGCKMPLIAAASGGYLETIKILLDHGANVNEGSPRPIVYAIRLESTAIFSLMRERGAILSTPETGGAALELASTEGLESMVNLLAQLRTRELALVVREFENKHGLGHIT
ncbi:hypothetical protein G7Y89_g13045 [Cudoniella acicularis]|uniref:Ankyrin n=1 Tax=Cudoniella acicularis TaxID=354080 RepID=A0A8H4VYL7_9HELO|nr:hypothetical protein G7Y89_g13045 [Cudoniella acicularis]